MAKDTEDCKYFYYTYRDAEGLHHAATYETIDALILSLVKEGEMLENTWEITNSTYKEIYRLWGVK